MPVYFQLMNPNLWRRSYKQRTTGTVDEQKPPVQNVIEINPIFQSYEMTKSKVFQLHVLKHVGDQYLSWIKCIFGLSIN